MIRTILLTSFLFLGFTLMLETSFAESAPIFSVTNCNGTRVVRTDIGQLEISHVEVNSENCVGAHIPTV